MKIYLKVIVLGIILSVGLCGCGSQNTQNEHNDLISSEMTEMGYYSLIDEGYGTSVKSQVEGTCWVYAASISMESAYKKEYGQDIEIDPLSILEAVQGNDKKEGFFLKEHVNGKQIGGWAWQIVETLSNGFGEYTLIEAENYESADDYKEQIWKKGGMNVAVNDANRSLFADKNGYKTLNDPDSDDFDHEVVIVGWDDDFPKDLFSKEASQNGAWLAQNTLGDSWGNNGYYWISYDTPFREQTIFRLSKDYSEVLSYDGGNENSISAGETTTVANVFHKTGILRAVGTYNTEPDQSVIIEIYDKDFSEVLYKQEETFDFSGYHTIKLNEELELSDFAIAITYTNSAPVEGESWEDGWLRYSVGINEGESYVFIDGKWLDMSNPETVELLNIDFEPNNCCIKAIY